MEISVSAHESINCVIHTREFLNFFSFIPKTTDQWFRNLVRTNKSSRSKDFQSHDLFHTLLQIQDKHSKHLWPFNGVFFLSMFSNKSRYLSSQILMKLSWLAIRSLCIWMERKHRQLPYRILCTN